MANRGANCSPVLGSHLVHFDDSCYRDLLLCLSRQHTQSTVVDTPRGDTMHQRISRRTDKRATATLSTLAAARCWRVPPRRTCRQHDRAGRRHDAGLHVHAQLRPRHAHPRTERQSPHAGEHQRRRRRPQLREEQADRELVSLLGEVNLKHDDLGRVRARRHVLRPKAYRRPNYNDAPGTVNQSGQYNNFTSDARVTGRAARRRWPHTRTTRSRSLDEPEREGRRPGRRMGRKPVLPEHRRRTGRPTRPSRTWPAPK